MFFGGKNESGEFVIEPGDWKYTENNDDIAGVSQNPERDFDKVTFERFRESMGEVDAMIGRNSYFSQEILAPYYGGNDMEENPVTERQHREFYEGDHVTGAFARYYCDSISLVVLGLFKSLAALVRFCRETGAQPDVFAFAKYVLLWILPTVLLFIAIGLFLTVLTENYSGVLIAGLLWLAGRLSAGLQGEILRPLSFRVVAALRIGISMAGTFALVMVFEIYMRTCGSIFPMGVYAVWGFVACMALGFAGLLCASVAKSTVAGYLGAFCYYFVVQAGTGDSMLKPVTNGIHPLFSVC